MKLLRRDRPPESVLALLDKGERVLSWGDSAAGEVVLATPLGIWWPADSGIRRIGWQYVSKATWQGDVLTVTEGEVTDDLIHDLRPVAVTLATPRDLPIVVRKRVNANIVSTELATIAGGAVRFVGRRIPGADGVAWWARLEPGTPLSEDVRSAVRARLDRLRAQWDAAQG